MISRHDVRKGSWLWTLGVAELTAWGTVVILAGLIHVAALSSTEYRYGLALVISLAVWFAVLFRVVLSRPRHRTWGAAAGIVSSLAYASWAFGLLRGDVPSIQLVFVPVIVVTGLLSNFTQALAAAMVAVGCYWGVAALAGGWPHPLAGTLNSAVFILSGSVAGLLSRELRTHYRGEQEEHRLATAVRLRLLAVLDAVDEAILFRDNQGIARVINHRLGDLFDLDPEEYLGAPAVEVLRAIARLSEDPEEFMEKFQELRDDPDQELRFRIEQIIPERRNLRVFSAPARDDAGELVGRIDVYSDVTESVARAKEVEELYEEARKVAESYQRSLLPDETPKLPRVNLVAHYLPAAGQRAVCGDFYDFVPMAEGRLGLVLGDVCGIGPQAASDSALTRYTLRSFATELTSPDKMLKWMNTYLSSQLDSERFVRLVYATLDPERARLDYANAGHVAPVLYRAQSGEIERLEQGGLALGIDPDAQYKVGHVDFEPGDMLVLFTDGVTEAPRHGRPLGQGKFGDLVQMYGVGTPGELVQALRRSVETWVDEELRDDLALVVLQIVPDVTLSELTRELVVPNEPARASDIRRFVAAFLVDVRAPVDLSHDILLSVGEAAGNAIRHGRRPEGRSEIRVQCSMEDSSVAVTVADDGPGFDPAETSRQAPPDRFSSGGRGLFLMTELMDSVDIHSGPQGSTVTLTRRIL